VTKDEPMKIFPKLRARFQKDKRDSEMAEEMKHHVELQTEKNLSAGMNPADAHYSALRKFGNVASIQEQAREGRSWLWLGQFLGDAGYAGRTLRKAPGFTGVMVLTLALGIGLNTIVFTFYGAVAFKPLPVRGPGEIVRVMGADDGRAPDTFAYGEVADLEARAPSLGAVIVSSAPQPMLAVRPGGKTGEVVVVRLVSDNYFSVLGVVPAAGRALGADEPAGAVLSHDFWQRQFGSDPAVVGQSILVQGVPVTILGVAPAAFAGTGLPAQRPNLWLPLTLQPALFPAVDWLHDLRARQWQVLARLKPGATLAQANAELAVVAHAWPAENDQPAHWRAQPATFFQLDSGEFGAFRVVSAC
jgi:hypothetical protein